MSNPLPHDHCGHAQGHGHAHGHHSHDQDHEHGHQHHHGQDQGCGCVHGNQSHSHHQSQLPPHTHAPHATGTLPMEIAPIGTIRSSVQEPHFFRDGKNQGLAQEPHTHPRHDELQTEIVIDPHWEELLDGIEGYSHIMVLYWPHLLTPEQRKIRKVHPMGRKDIAQQGIFATRSPARPNPILVTVARLLERKGNLLTVQGLEAVDGSPVLDIKPHTSSFYAANDAVVVPDWMAQLQAEHEERHQR